MRPLLYLTLRSLINGIKRAVTNPRRLVAFLFAMFWLVRFLLFPTRGEQRAFDTTRLHQATELMGNVDLSRILDALVFAAFTFITFFLALGSLSTRNSFRPADVDVLFPTPIEPKLVLVFRIFRDYLVTLLAPLFFILVGFRPASVGIKSLQNAAENPDSIAQTMRVATGAWMLVALCWVCINYAVSLFVNRSDLASTRNRKILGWTLGLGLIGVAAYVAWQASSFHVWQDWVGLAENPVLRTVFFTATLAMFTVHGMVSGEMAPLLLGFGGLIGIILISLRVSMSQASWMYDQAAAKGFDSVNARQLQQSGDTIGLVTAQARQGKVKAGRFTGWIASKTATGAYALLWKEALLSLRSTWFLILLFAAISLVITILPVFGTRSDQASAGAYIFLFTQSMGVFMSASALSQAGFIEMLRRVDVQKPLPFNFSTTILFEVLGKALPGTLTAWLCSIIAILVRPEIWQAAVGGALAMPFLAVVICLVTCLTTILFPDFDDPSQRGFRGIINFAGTIVACAPSILAFVGMIALSISPIFAALVSAGINVGVAALVASISGTQYAQFNPSE